MPSGKAWTVLDDESLLKLLEHGVDYKACAHTLNRSILAIRIRAHHLRKRKRSRTTSPATPPEPISQVVGPVAVASFQERVLAHSISSTSLQVPEPPTPKPATPEGRLRMAI